MLLELQWNTIWHLQFAANSIAIIKFSLPSYCLLSTFNTLLQHDVKIETSSCKINFWNKLSNFNKHAYLTSKYLSHSNNNCSARYAAQYYKPVGDFLSIINIQNLSEMRAKLLHKRQCPNECPPVCVHENSTIYLQ